MLKNRKKLLTIVGKLLIIVALIAIFILLQMATGTIPPWRRGALTDIYGFDSLEIYSLYVYSMREGDILFSTDEDDLNKISETLIDLNWHRVWFSEGMTLDKLEDTLQIYVVYRDANNNEESLLIYCTGDDSIVIRASKDVTYQTSGGYDLSWIYESNK